MPRNRHLSCGFTVAVARTQLEAAVWTAPPGPRIRQVLSRAIHFARAPFQAVNGAPLPPGVIHNCDPGRPVEAVVMP